MSEQDRSRLYDWWCEHADEALAEYAMSCLSPVPLPDLATKEDVREVKADVAKLDARVAVLDTKVAELDTKVAVLDTKVDLLATQHKTDREVDRRTNQVRLYWLAGISASAVVSVWLSAAGVIG